MNLFEGVRVLDLSRMLAGPYGSMLLADMGAEVIKIEEPDGGDPMRVMGPPFLPDGESAYFLAINRNKKSVALDLTKPAGRDVFLEGPQACLVVPSSLAPASYGTDSVECGVSLMQAPRVWSAQETRTARHWTRIRPMWLKLLIER